MLTSTRNRPADQNRLLILSFHGAANPQLVQACESLLEPRTRKRESETLNAAMAELGLKSGIIVTRKENEQIDTAGGTIDVIPVWRFYSICRNRGVAPP